MATMRSAIPEVPVTLEPWQALALVGIVERLKAAGGVPTITANINVQRAGARTNGNGGSTTTIAPTLKTFVVASPGATRKEIAVYLREQGVKFSPMQLQSAINKLKNKHELVVKGRRGNLKFYPAGAAT